MHDVHELSSVKDIVAPMFGVGADEAAHPIVGDDHGGEYFELAEGLQGDESKE